MKYTQSGFELWFEIHKPNNIKTDTPSKAINLLIHGWTGNRTRLQFIQDPLMELGHSIALIDLPGHGESSHNDNFDYDLDKVADLIDAFIRNIIIHEEGFKGINIIGHSMGGVIAQIIASKKPDYLNKLVLIVTSPNPMKGKKIGYRILSILFPLVQRRFLKNDKKKKLAMGIEHFPEFNQENNGNRLLPNHKAIAKYLKAIVKTNLESKIRNIKCPVLIIMGEKDSFGDSKAIEIFEKNFVNKQIIIIENTEHYPFITHKEKCIEVIQEFFSW